MTFNGKVGINAGHVKQEALKAKSMSAFSNDTPQSLLRAYQSCGWLPLSATTKDALSLKRSLVSKELEKAHISHEIERAKQLHPLAEPNNFTLDEIISMCKGKEPQEILRMLDIETQILPGGRKELSEYLWKPYNYSFKLAEIDENKLLEGVESIKGVCDLSGSCLKNLGSVKSVGELILPTFTRIEDLSGLEHVGKIRVNELFRSSEICDIMNKLNLKPDVLKRAYVSIF